MKTGFCECSAYEGAGSGEKRMKVNQFQCVIDGNKYPCFYVLMPERTWYDEKSHDVEFMLRGLVWRLCHLFYAYRFRGERMI